MNSLPFNTIEENGYNLQMGFNVMVSGMAELKN